MDHEPEPTDPKPQSKIGRLFDRWPEAVALGEKMDYVSVAMGDERSHAILAQALRRGRPVCGHIYGREFVAAGAASGITDTHESIDREIANDFLENGVWIFLRGGNPTTPWHSLPQAIKAVTELGALSPSSATHTRSLWTTTFFTPRSARLGMVSKRAVSVVTAQIQKTSRTFA